MRIQIKTRLDERTVNYIKTTLKAYQEEEPKSGWHLETRGESKDWHDWEA
jgi:hypothetical protein